MSQQIFVAELGLGIDDGVSLLNQSGLPGTSQESIDAVIGSYSSDLTSGLQYRKKTAGSGTDKWIKIADSDDITAAGGTESWREPALIKDDTVYANLAAAEIAVNTGTIDGVTLSANDRILFTGITGEGKNVFIVTGTPGAGATLVEDTNSETNNDAILIDDGTFAGKQFNYNSTSNTWVQSNQTSLDELGFIRAFIGKDASGSETPTYTSTVNITNGDTLEVAAGKLDAAVSTNATNIGTNTTSIGNLQTEVDLIETSMGAMIDSTGAYVPHTTSNYINGNTDVTTDLLDLDAQVKANADAIGLVANDDTFQNTFMGKTGLGAETPTYSSALVVTQSGNLEAAIGELDAHADRTNHEETASGITTLTVIDSVLVDDVKAVRWLVHVQQGNKVQTFEIDATHDGTASADAVDTDFTKYAKLKMNGNIVGLTVAVSLTGVAAAQTMQLTVTSSAAVEVSSSRLSVI